MMTFHGQLSVDPACYDKLCMQFTTTQKNVYPVTIIPVREWGVLHSLNFMPSQYVIEYARVEIHLS